MGLDQVVDAAQAVGHARDDLDRVLRQGRLRGGDDAPLAQQVAQGLGVAAHPPLVRLENHVGGAFAGLRARGETVLARHQSVTRPEYEPSRVSTLTRVPSSMKRGTWIS